MSTKAVVQVIMAIKHQVLISCQFYHYLSSHENLFESGGRVQIVHSTLQNIKVYLKGL